MPYRVRFSTGVPISGLMQTLGAVQDELDFFFSVYDSSGDGMTVAAACGEGK